MNRRVTHVPPKNNDSGKQRSAAAERNALPRVGLRQWLFLHRRAAKDAFSRLTKRRSAAILGLMLMGLALALPLMLLTLIANLDRLLESMQRSGEIALFLAPGTSAERVSVLSEKLRIHPGVTTVVMRTPAEGLRELQSVPGFEEAIAAAGANPLPYLLLVRPREERRAAALAEEFAALPEVDQVQHDQQWRDRLQRLLDLLHRVARAAALLFVLAALLVVGNHVRLEVEMRREEIGIVTLLGASDGFVRRPFLWSGFWLGSIGASIAIATALSVRAYFDAPVRSLAASYDSAFVLQGPDIAWMFTTLVAGVLLGSIGAYVASSLQLANDRAS